MIYPHNKQNILLNPNKLYIKEFIILETWISEKFNLKAIKCTLSTKIAKINLKVI